jgi:MoaA/NifB/PqqE/SkfB family radical SAM enzyme
MKSVIDIQTNRSFCPAAWNSIYVEPGGEIRNCCVAQETIGTVDDDIHGTLTRSRNFEIRQEMLAGQTIASCRQCEPDAQWAMRNAFLVDYFRPENNELFSSADNFLLQYLDLRWHNTCNFACVYCGPGVSSSWASELGEPNRMDRDKIQRLESYVLDNLQHVNHVYLAGGEPLLMKENAALLERLHAINPDARIFVNSNISHANPDNVVYQWLTRFPRAYWIISAEALDQRFDYIRYGGSWPEFERNLAQIRKDFKTDQIGFNAVLCTLNAIDIWRFADWIFKIGFDARQISINMHHQATTPWHGLDCRNLSESLTQVIKALSNDSRYNGITNISGLRTALDQPVEINPALFQDFVKEIDQRRGLDSRKIFPEIYAHIN